MLLEIRSLVVVRSPHEPTGPRQARPDDGLRDMRGEPLMSRASALIRATDCCLTVLFCATVFLIVVATPAAAQLAEVNAILKRYTELFDAGNYPAALVEAQKLEAAVTRGFRHKPP